MGLGFNLNESKVFKDLVVNHDFTNAIIFGRTGSGKTSCAILPNIENRIKSNYGLLVYDFKGNLHLQVKYLANKYERLSDVIEIGKPWGKKINICDYLSINNLSQIVGESNVLDNYWTNASKNLFEVIYKIHKDLNYLIVELNDELKKSKKSSLFFSSEFVKNSSYNQIQKYINSLRSIKEFYTTTLEIHNELKFVLNFDMHRNKNYLKYKTCSKILDNISELLSTLEFYNYTKIEDTGGRNAVLNHLSSILVDVAKKDFLNESQIDIVKELRSGKIVIVDVSTFNENSLNIINLAIYTRLQKILFKDSKPVTIFIDEAQKVLNSNYLPQVDVCRESKFEYIFATQDEILLENKLGQNKFAELYINIITKYSFASNSNDIVNNFEFIDLSTNRKAFANPLFIDKNDLIKIEYLFQKKNDILSYSDYEDSENGIYVLKYDEKLIEEYKILIEKINGEYEETKFILFPNTYKMEETSKNINDDSLDCDFILEEIIID